MCVSTHSHPKVAALLMEKNQECFHRFNTQSPEGGCLTEKLEKAKKSGFNTQSPEGGCLIL